MRKLVITLFCITLLIPSRGNTLGLGEIELQSSLNEELKAEIPLTSVGQESADTIIVQLATREEFARAGIDRPFILTDLNFAVKDRNGVLYIEVTSKKAIREPFLSFLIDIDWPRGHILREFTMLLDPPVFMQATPDGVPAKTVVSPQSQNTAPASPVQQDSGFSQQAVSNNQAFAPSAPVNNAQTFQQVPAQQTYQQVGTQQTRRFVPSYQMPADAYRVQQGDTAWKIAEQLRANSNVSVEQMMMALLRRNPEAFINENINGVKRGYILRMPSQQEVQALDNQTALAQVKQQYAQWREYQQAVVARRNANQIDRNKTADSSESSSVSETQGRLTIASAAEKEGSVGMTSGSQNPEAELQQLRQDLASTTEELESGKIENQELKERINALQTRLKKMERLLNLKDGDLAKMQSDLEPETTLPASDSMTEQTATPEMVPAEADMQADAPTDAVEPAMTDPAEQAMDQQTNDQMAGTDTPADDMAEMDGMSSAESAENVFKDEMAAPVQPPVQQPPVALPPAQAFDQGKAKSPLEAMLTDPNSLPYIAGGAIGIILLVLLIIIRRKKAKAADENAVAELPETGDFDFDDVVDENDFEGGFNDEAEQELSDKLDAFAEEAEADAADEAVISLDDDQPSEDEIPKDDILAEADVYLAYGIHQQAEELLKTAIAENPDRNDYKVKLLETYFAAKDKAGFITLAEVLQEKVDTESAEWARVVAMGRELDSANPLFSGMGDMPNFDVDDLLPSKPETDFDLGEAAADFDLGDAIDENDDFDLGLDDDSLDDEIPATVALSPEEAASYSSGLGVGDDTDNFALNDDGLDELDQELADLDGNDDLDFGLNDTAEADNTAEVSDEDFSLDFEMADLGLDEADAEVSAEETEAIASAMEPEIEEPKSDESFDLAADLEDDVEMDLGDLSSELDIDLPDDDIASDDISLDIGDIDLSADLTADLEDDVSLDLGDIDLSADDDATVVRSLSDDDDEPIDISSLPDDLDEVNTKLDLARAYIDMGDDDGAASILREVIEEAAGDQKQQAEDMLAKIA